MSERGRPRDIEFIVSAGSVLLGTENIERAAHALT
jgi:hypothetical protein